MEYKILFNKIVIGKTKKGDVFKIDLCDLALISKYSSWSKSGPYFVAYDSKLGKNIYMHRLIMNVHTCECDRRHNVVHHIDRNTTNNCRNNLELVSTQQNLFHQKRKKNISKCTGVTWNSGKNRWQATIRFNGKLIMLGMFKDVDRAIKLRKLAEQIYFK